ncbi:hypothetical protein BDW62DRAFT_218485 [Aspergillus aurantiobrunneus]
MQEILKSEHLEFTVPATSLNPFEKLSESIEQQPFSTSRSLMKRLDDRHLALENDMTREQFLFARLSYNVATQILIVKIMPSRAHEAASQAFFACIRDEIIAMQLQDEIDELGKADERWALSIQNTPLTTILEIGLSELSERLALNAKGWLETSNISVQVAITLDICRSIPRIIIKRYGICPRCYSIETRASPTSASCVQAISINRQNNITTVSCDLKIPFREFAGRDINPSSRRERDL